MPRPFSSDHYSAEDVIRLLRLEPLDQEGAYFRRTAESDVFIPDGALPKGIGGRRRAYSCIYALITPDGFSAMHRLTNDEVWCFHAGDTLEQLRLAPDGRGEWVKLGHDVAAGERPQDVVRADWWQGTRLAAGGRWALFTNVLAPEFRWEDFELGGRAELAARYPEFREGIESLTRAEAPKGKK
jgi:hypothetical protein